jgi:hypothetical protein
MTKTAVSIRRGPVRLPVDRPASSLDGRHGSRRHIISDCSLRMAQAALFRQDPIAPLSGNEAEAALRIALR